MTEIRYYALLAAGRTRTNPSGIMRRRTVRGQTTDEVFTRNLTWEPTEYFGEYALGHNDIDHVEITEPEASQFVARLRAKLAK